MCISSGKRAVLFFLAAGLAGVSASIAGAPAAPKPAGPGILLLVRDEGPYQLLTPDGKTVSEFAAPAKTHNSGGGCLSPDGTRVAVVVGEDSPPPPVLGEVGWPFKVVVRALGKPGRAKTWDTRAMTLDLHWTADGKRLVVVKYPDVDDGKNVENLLLDPETGETEPLDLPAGVWVLDPARDGKTFLVALAEEKKVKLGLATTGDAAIRELAEVPDWRPGRVFGRLSPDATKVLCAVPDPARKNAHHFGVSQRPYLLDVRTRKAEPLPDFPENGWVTGVAWSPDGRRIAYTWQRLHEELLKKDTLSGNDTEIETEAFLIVAGADGSKPKTVASEKGRFALNVMFGAIDWR